MCFASSYETWAPQMRWGFGRIAGPYGHAILAGMIFLMGLIYCLWLRSADRNWGARRADRRLADYGARAHADGDCGRIADDPIARARGWAWGWRWFS